MRFIIGLSLIIITFSCCSTNTQAPGNNLPLPGKKHGKPLMMALADRQSTRDFDSTEISIKQLSELLWAANGINRPETKRRTAPSARNKQEIDIYVATKNGLFIYDAFAHKLNLISNEDIRAYVGEQAFHKVVPLTLLLVADYSRTDGDNEGQRHNSAINTGYISQNIYLYCASEGLATVAVGWLNYDLLKEKMKLRNNQQLMLGHPIGFKKKGAL
jgi:SagB-type dehydrogenase family enzyme